MGEPVESVRVDGRLSRDVHNPLLFEICSEIGRQLGGVYSVLKSKALVTALDYGRDYTLIGPLDRRSTAAEVDEVRPTTPSLKAAIETMKKRGIDIVYGRWLIEGSPRVLLIDTDSHYSKLDAWKQDFLEVAGIKLPPDDKLSNDAVVFGYLVAEFLEEFVRHEKKKAVIAQFHEWRSSLGVILTKKRQVDIATIFTAHATVLGRYLCDTRDDFYSKLETFDDRTAQQSDVYHRHCIEKASAHACDVLTTVSHITAYECEFLLGRRPEGVLPNGLNIAQFAGADESNHLRYNAKQKIRDFVRGHFYGQLHHFNHETTLYFFMAGRYEFKNKGVDLFIESLAQLNERLIALDNVHDKEPPTVVAILIMPAPTSSVTSESLASQAIVKSLRDTVTYIEKNMGRRLFERSLTWRDGVELPSKTEMISEQEHTALRRRLHGIKRDGQPPLVTHNLVHHDDDPIINHLLRVGLSNKPSDKVKVVFYPEFLRSSNPILPMDYDEFVRGTHLGVFPSYYEPWGYTPAECTALGIPSITSDVSGFGAYISKHQTDASGRDQGVFIVNRRTKTFEESIKETTDYMYDFCQLGDWERAAQRNRTKRLGEALDWNRMNIEYENARKLALRQVYPKAFKTRDDNEEVSEWAAEVQKEIVLVSSHGKLTNGYFEAEEE